ncbi:MAG: polysaccharide deacetylase family protein [Fibrobacter sp.]|nr:polysaccharide deacetylase family protein [Fibrobacter sp.]
MKLYFRGPNNFPAISITFDDGPHPSYTPQLLQVLDRFNVKGTFFMTGANARKNKILVKEVSDQGHEIANHSLNHLKQLLLPPDVLENEIKASKDILESIIERKTTLYRPPHGYTSPFLFSLAKKLDFKVILWSINAYDYRDTNPVSITRRVVSRLKKGSIVLFHECNARNPDRDYTQTATALSDVLMHIKNGSFNAVTISELLTRFGT